MIIIITKGKRKSIKRIHAKKTNSGKIAFNPRIFLIPNYFRFLEPQNEILKGNDEQI